MRATTVHCMRWDSASANSWVTGCKERDRSALPTPSCVQAAVPRANSQMAIQGARGHFVWVGAVQMCAAVVRAQVDAPCTDSSAVLRTECDRPAMARGKAGR